MSVIDDRAEFSDARPRDVALLKVLFMEGRDISKRDATERWHIGPRQFRAAVRALRLSGYPIVSRSLADSTYHRARSEDELEEFIRKELMPRATDLLAQASALRRDARTWFSPIQPELIASGGGR